MFERLTQCLVTASLLTTVPLSAACGRQTPFTAPQDGRFLDAERSLQSGDYPTAVETYRQLLETEPGAVRQLSLFRLAVVEGLDGLETTLVGNEYRDRFALEYPESPLNAQVELTTTLLSQLASLRAERAREIREFESLTAEFARIVDAWAETDELATGNGPIDLLPDPGLLPVPVLVELEPQISETGLAELDDALVRLSDASSDSPLAAGAQLGQALLSEVRQLRLEAAGREARMALLNAQVYALAEELEKLREADLRRRLPN